MSLPLSRSTPFAVMGILVLALAACSSGSGSSAGAAASADAPSAAAESEAAESEAAESQGAPAEESSAATGDATVVVADSDLGQILTDAEGMTLYYFANDTEGVSNCEGDCLAAWPPLEADGEPTAGDGVEAELGTIERSDGTMQVTVNGFPAYYYAADQEPGDVTGQGVGDVWWVFGADGEPIEE